jgi:anti-anti-sigma factor
MELEIRRDDANASVHVTGALDLATSGELHRALSALRDDGARRIRLDVSALDFVDSPGLSVLLRWQDEARSRGEEFTVHGARGLVKRVLRETGTARVLEA